MIALTNILILTGIVTIGVLTGKVILYVMDRF